MLRRIRLAQLTMDTACKILGRGIRIMEVCGSHTVSIFRNSIRQSVPRDLQILTGPGCSVCVIDPGYLKILYNLTQREDIVITARADIMNVPLNENRDKLSDFENIITVPTILDALQRARSNPDKKVVFAGIGYQTCIPGTAVALEIAEKESLTNFFILPSFKIVYSVMQKLLERSDLEIDAFLICGNMSALTGMEIYQPIMDKNIPCVPTGTEPMQLIEGLAETCRQLKESIAEPSYDFSVGVTYKGNITAEQYTEKYFEPVDAYWRGIGKIENSGLTLKKQYEHFNAFKQLGIEFQPMPDTSGCRCGEIISGTLEPHECSMYIKNCTPQDPNGPCMASSEGACNVWQRYSPKNKA